MIQHNYLQSGWLLYGVNNVHPWGLFRRTMKVTISLTITATTKLRQGNVFTPVCLPFCSQGEACMGGRAWLGACVAEGCA